MQRERLGSFLLLFYAWSIAYDFKEIGIQAPWGRRSGVHTDRHLALDSGRSCGWRLSSSRSQYQGIAFETRPALLQARFSMARDLRDRMSEMRVESNRGIMPLMLEGHQREGNRSREYEFSGGTGPVSFQKRDRSRFLHGLDENLNLRMR